MASTESKLSEIGQTHAHYIEGQDIFKILQFLNDVPESRRQVDNYISLVRTITSIDDISEDIKKIAIKTQRKAIYASTYNQTDSQLVRDKVANYIMDG